MQEQTPTVFKVLLVEDDQEDAQWLTQLLAQAGPGRFEVRHASRLDQAMHLIDDSACDLLLLDLFLPDIQGFDTFTRACAYAPQCPIIVLSVSNDEALAMRCVHEGAQDYLVKRQIDGRLLEHAVRYAVERHRVEQALARERDLLHTLLETLPDRIYFKDRQSRFIRINRALAQLFELPDPAQAVGKSDFDFFTPSHAAPALSDEQEVMRTSQPLIGKVEEETMPDGRVGWVLTTKAPLRDGAGRIIGTFGVSKDISDLKKMEGVLAAERNLLRGLIDGLPDHIYVKDPQSRFLVVNAALQRYLGEATPEAVTGKTDFDFFPREAATAFMAEEQELLRSGEPIINREAQLVDRSGQLKWILTTKVPLRDAKGRCIGLVGVNRDVTAQKLAEAQMSESNAALARREQELMAALADVNRSHQELQSIQLQLVQAEKMESIGRLAAGIAHEVKNPLAVVAMGLDYLSHVLAQAQPAGAPPETEDGPLSILKNMKDAVKRADGVIRGLLDFSAPSTLRTTPSDLNDAIRQALTLVRHHLVRHRVTLRMDLDETIPAVLLDMPKIQQVFVNLFLNAAQAMPDGGVLTVRTHTQTGNGSPDAVIADVEDTGQGIPDDKLGKVFDPFFTTKPPGKGTGLGLSVSKTIVELHRASISLTNRTDGGARATLVFKIEGV